MKKITDPSKLLPAAKSAAVTRTKRAAIKPSSALVTRPKKESAIVKAPEKSAAIVKKEQKSTEYVNVRLIAIENLFRNDFANVRKEAEEKRKKEEEQDFTEAEKKLETPKSRKLNLGGGGGDSPSLGFFDRLKRFLFFTTLGWLLPKIIDFLPKLEGTLKTIGTVYKFAEGLFGKLFDGFMTLVKFGGDLKKQTLGFIAGMKGGDYQTEFTKLEKTFDTFVNASIIAGVLAADIGFAAVDEFNKWRGKNKKLESEKAKPVKRGKEEKPKVTQGRGGRAAAGAASRVTQGKGGKAPGWWNKILRGPFAKLKGPLSKFAGAAVPGLGAVVGAADARARFAAGDRIGGSLASVSAALDVATVASALTGVGLPIAGALSTISIGIDALLLIRDITKTFFPFIPMFSHGGRVVNKYQGGGTARTTRRPPPKPPKVKKPIKTKPPETKVGRDVGGENKVVQFYAKDTKEKTPIFGSNFAAALNFFSGGLKNKEQNRPLEALKRTSKILKELPFGLGYFAGGAIDIALGQSMDVKKGLGQLSSGIAYMVDSLANQRVNMSMTSLIRDLNAFAEGGTIPASRTLSTSYSVSSGDLIARVIGPTIEQKVNEAMQSIEKDLRSLQQKKKEEPPSPGPSSGELGVIPGSISISGGSSDFWALVAITALESENSQGRADVAQSIYNRVGSRLNFGQREHTIKGHVIAPGQYSPVGESDPKLWANIVDRQSAIAAIESHPRGRGRGRLLADAAAAAITDSSLQKKAAEFVGGRTDFNATSVYPQDPSNGVGITSRLGHRFGWFVGPESISYGRRAPGPASVPSLGATVTRTEESGAYRISQSGFSTGLVTGPSEKPGFSGNPIGSGTKYHIDARVPSNLSLNEKIALIDSIALAYAAQGRSMYFSGTGVENQKWDPNMPGDQKERFARRVLSSHWVRRGGWDAFDFFSVPRSVTAKTSDEEFYRSAAGAQIMAPYIEGGSVEYWNEPGSGGRGVNVYDKNGRLVFKTMHGDLSVPSSMPTGRRIPMSELSQRVQGTPSQTPEKPPKGVPRDATGIINFVVPDDGTKITYYTLNGKYYALVEGDKNSLEVGKLRYEQVLRQTSGQQQQQQSKLAKRGGREGIIVNGTWKPKTWSPDERERYQRTQSGEQQPNPKSKGKGNWWDVLNPANWGKPQSKPPPKMQQGGIIRPRGSQLPIPNAYASYESSGGGTLIAIQPYVIKEPSYSSGNRTIAFPVPMALNNTNKNLEALSRG